MDATNTRSAGTTRTISATAGVLGAILASSCCIVPLLLVTLGISGAWIGRLTQLEPYQPYFVVITLGFLVTGYWHVYFKPRKVCEAGSYCARPGSDRLVKIALWASTVLVLATLTIDLWAPLFY